MDERQHAHSVVRYFTAFLALACMVGAILTELPADIVVGGVVGAGITLVVFRIAV